MLSHAYQTLHQTLPEGDPALILVDIGTALWLVAYIIAIIQGFKEKTYSIPLVAICSNFTWEVLASFDWVAPVELWHIGAILWMVLDAIIVYQLFRFGRAQQVIPEIKESYYLILVSTFALAFCMQYTYSVYYDDRLGFEDAYVINTTMSILFLFMYFTRRETGNYTYWIAWAKMFGTGITSVGLIFIFPKLYPERTIFGFIHLLWVTIFVLDLTYVLVLRDARKRQRASSDPKVPVSSLSLQSTDA